MNIYRVTVCVYKDVDIDAKDERDARRIIETLYNEEMVRDAPMYDWKVIDVRQIGKSSEKTSGIKFGR